MNEKQKNFNSEECEEIISNNLINYIQNGQLLNLSIPIIHRILIKYQKKNETIQPEINEFLFKCLDKYKCQASILFEIVDFGSSNSEVYHRLLEDYSNDFDFHFINKNQIKNIYELSNEIIKQEEKNRFSNQRIEEDQTKIRKEFEQFKQDIYGEKDSQIQQLQQFQQEMMKKFEEIAQKKDLQIQKLQQEMMEKIEKIAEEKESQFKQLQQKMINKIDEINRENERRILQQKDEINHLKEAVEQQAIIINQLKSEIKEMTMPRISLHFTNEPKPKGIIECLFDSVAISAGGSHDPKYPLLNIKYDDNCSFYNYYKVAPNSESDSFIKFDFGPFVKIELSSYLIRSNGDSASSYHPKSWRIEGSNDDLNWTRIDHRVNNENLNGSYNKHHFECHENRPGDKNFRYRYIRWVQEDSWYYTNNRPYYVYILYFELYGEVFIYK